jgi:uncharacterized protein (TIGR01777 family)
MRVLVTGATGFIGQALCTALRDRGREVIALTRDPRTAARVLPSSVEVARWDGKTPDGWAHLADGAGAIVNLAGENVTALRWTETRKRSLVSSRVEIGHAVTECVRRAAARPAVVLQASGVCWYGPRVVLPVTESAPAGEGFMADLARQWEASTAEVGSSGTRWVALRLGAVLGRTGGPLPRRARPFRAFLGGPIGSGDHHYAWIHLDDAVAAMIHLIDRPDLAGPFNVVAPQAVRMDEFCRELGRALKRPSWLRIPPAVPRAILGEMVNEALLCGQNAAPHRLTSSGFRFRFPDLRAALADLYR